MYTIKVLKSEEFDRLPYKYANESLGLADPKTNTAYVRRLGWDKFSKKVTALTMHHELEELMAKTSPHEEDGIRYKKFWKEGVMGSTVGKILVPIVGGLLTGGLAGPALGLGSTMSSALGAAAGAGISGGTAAAKDEPWLMPALTGALGGWGGATMGPGMAAGWEAGSGILGKPLSALQGGLFGTVGTGANTMSLLGKSGGPVSSLFGASPGFEQTAGEAIKTTGAPSSIMGILDSPYTKLGLGSMALSALPTSPKPPDMGPIISKWLTADTVTAAGAKAREIADVEYMGEFQVSKETQAFMEVMEKDIAKAYKRRRESLDATSMAANPQWKRSGERLEMMRRINEEEQREIDAMKSQWIMQAKSEHAQRQYTYVIEQLNADEATKRDLLYGELSDVIWKYNIKEEDLMNFRKIAADAGMYMLGKGVGMYG